jgi:hypothetical protein
MTWLTVIDWLASTSIVLLGLRMFQSDYMAHISSIHNVFSFEELIMPTCNSLGGLG